jgi:[ribosomal protein S18]-alanine N-acetyltransferase
VRVRRANVSDLPAILALDRQNLTAAHWSEQHYETLFAKSVSHTSEAFALVAENEPESGGSEELTIIAFLVAHCIGTEWELQNLVVAENHRRKGAATKLIKELSAAVRARDGRVIFLEVRQSNQAARGLYRKLGFEETGLRKSYYSNPSENAIICRLAF